MKRINQFRGFLAGEPSASFQLSITQWYGSNKTILFYFIINMYCKQFFKHVKMLSFLKKYIFLEIKKLTNFWVINRRSLSFEEAPALEHNKGFLTNSTCQAFNAQILMAGEAWRVRLKFLTAHLSSNCHSLPYTVRWGEEEASKKMVVFRIRICFPVS